MNDLIANISSDCNQEYEEINGGSPIQKRILERGSLIQQLNNRDIDQADSCHSTSTQNQSLHQNQINSKQSSSQKSQDRKKRSSSILQASISSTHTTSRSFVQGNGANQVLNGNICSNHNNGSQNNTTYMFDELFTLDREMFAEKLQIQNSVLKTEKNCFELELKRKAEIIEQLEKKIQEIQKKYKNDIERKEQLEIEQTILQKKINDIVNIYENNNGKEDVNQLLKMTTDLRSELNLKQMIIDKQKETIKSLQQQNEILQKNEVEILEAQKKSQLIVDKFETVNKDLQRFLKQSTEMQIKLRNQLMISESNRQLLEEKYNVHTQRAAILNNNHNTSMGQDLGSRASLMMNNEILRQTRGSHEQSFAFNHLDSINQDISFKKQNQNQINQKREELIQYQRFQERSIEDQQEQDTSKARNTQKITQNNDKQKYTQQQLHSNSLAAAAAEFSKFQGSMQCHDLCKEELSNQIQEQESIINLSLLSDSVKQKEINTNQPLLSARQQGNTNKLLLQFQNSQVKNNNNNLMSSLKEHILSLSENKENLNEQLHEILKESKRGNEKNVKELMVKFETRLGQFFNELSNQAEILVILQQRLDQQDNIIEEYHRSEQEKLEEQKQKYKKQIKSLLKDIDMLTSQKEEIVKKFEEQVNQSYEQAKTEVQRQYQNQIEDLKSLLDQALIREQQLDLCVRQYKENSNQKQQRMLQRFKNNSISSQNLNGVGIALNNSYNLVNENQNTQINIEKINSGFCGDPGSKTNRDNIQHQQTRDESEFKENTNSQNMISNRNEENNKSTLTNKTYSPAPSNSINYLSTEQLENVNCQFSVRNNTSNIKFVPNQIEGSINQQQIFYPVQNNNLYQSTQSDKYMQRKTDENSYHSSKNYNLSVSSQSNQVEQNSLDFSHGSHQQQQIFNNNNSIRNSIDTNRSSRNFNKIESNFNTTDNRQIYQKIIQNNTRQSYQQDQISMLEENQNSSVQVQKRLIDQFSTEAYQKQNMQIKKNMSSNTLQPHQYQSQQENKYHNELKASQKSYDSQSSYHLQDTFGQQDQGFNQHQSKQLSQYNQKSNKMQQKANSSTLARANSYTNLNSSRNNSQAGSSCVGEQIESIHIMKESKQLNSFQNYDSYNSNYNSQRQVIQQINGLNQPNQILNQEHFSEEQSKSNNSDLNAFNNFTFTQSQQNYNDFSDIEAYYKQQQQTLPNIAKLQEYNQIQQKIKNKNLNKLQIVTDTYDEHKLDQIQCQNQRSDNLKFADVNKSSSCQRIRSQSSSQYNFVNNQSTQNSSDHMLTENNQDQMNLKQKYNK
ncbi:hypothetical protein TTHERM_00189070 (macronuclear) [Tetrahymena thermophila SB210]|uniref:Uncharacterized protein n=1 Tax=Tetrahymena thermophila (strain SB210) TaxID=312017 RepID=I7MEH0_TETTS|nr:hypothetical protein TTHERM_00189070 [Tetrahymena thermophila SB210]EAR96338.1 hypothetical protein TTHERM_00189070 [Tetrahymena thermophila SB210]|eukprot:XP_001016583.1 hypothetical protein TTHERM_00189070 [Tetrahymena thermophila SB210]